MLKRTIAREYHRQSIGLYLLILLIGLGFLRSEEHVQLARLMMSRVDLLLLISTFWGLHVLKTSLFFVKTMRQPAYGFLYDVVMLPRSSKWVELIGQQLSLNAIFLVYAVFMATIGCVEKEWLNVGILLIINLLLIIVPVSWKNNFLKTPNADQTNRPSFFDKLPAFQLPPAFFFVMLLLKKEPIYLFLQKVFAAIMIVAIAYFYPTDDYDERLLKLGIFFVSCGYFTLSQRYFSFYKDWLFSRNLPLARGSILKHFLINAVLFSLPELLLFVTYLPDNVSLTVIADSYLYVVCTLVFWQTAIFWVDFTNTRLNLLLFLGYIAIFLLLMFGVPLSFVGGTTLIFTVYQLRNHYYSFEMSEE